MSKLETSVEDRIHAIFSAVTGVPLKGDRVVGLQVRADSGVPDLNLDLYAKPMQIWANLTVVGSMCPTDLARQLETAIKEEIL